MLCFVSLQSWFVRFFRLGLACFFCWCSGGVNAEAGDIKINGLHFTLGEPIDHPVAKVTIAELVQGAQKRGFLRISLLPVALAKGMEIRFLRPEIAVLKEVQETLRSMAKLEQTPRFSTSWSSVDVSPDTTLAMSAMAKLSGNLCETHARTLFFTLQHNRWCGCLMRSLWRRSPPT